jgi:hypothetical protein
MDIFAHAVWTNIMARIAKQRAARRERFVFKIGWATFFGVFPDLFAFTISFSIGIYGLITGTGFVYGRETIATGLAPMLYQYSHSLVIWGIVFCLVSIIYKKPRWELLGWALHIIIDIPSHAGGFYLTPFLFPISDYKFTHGISWAHPVFMLVNYSALLIAWGMVLFYKYKNRKI